MAQLRVSRAIWFGGRGLDRARPFLSSSARLRSLGREDLAWFADRLDRKCVKLGTRIAPAEGGRLRLLTP